MKRTPITHLIPLGLLVAAVWWQEAGSQGSRCTTTGWFGSGCRYKCHCAGNLCDSNGECTGSSTCERGWFGPACQYVDLVWTNSTQKVTPAWLYDDPDTKCATGQDSQTVTITLNDTFYFTWLRLRVSQPGISQNYNIQLSLSNNGIDMTCPGMKNVPVNNTVLDIHCDPGVKFQQLTLTADGVSSLCSIYISGGRNVALKQNTVQSSNYYGYTSDKAVDGERNNNFNIGSCSHTEPYLNVPATWTLNFHQTQRVSRYVIYNRNDAEQQRIVGFALKADQKNGSLAFNYTNPSGSAQPIYNLPSSTPEVGIFSVTITQKNGEKILTLCEVEMFGDTVCETGAYYGRECGNPCNCDKNTDYCFVSTGGCPSGCAQGYQGEACKQPCDATRYGKNCALTCSTNCMNQLCDPIKGTCQSCIPGKQGLMCDQDCDATYFSVNCTQRCNSQCKGQLCDTTTGDCKSCEPGVSGKECNEVCNATFYGENCAQSCSSNCKDRRCHNVYGNCSSCEAGKSGPTCSVCKSTFYGENCAQSCSSNCKDHRCHNIYGNCSSCEAGKSGPTCSVCGATTFGENCANVCSTNCQDQHCNNTDGNCITCVAGHSGSFCENKIDSGESFLIAVIVGPIVAFIVLVLLIIIGVIIWRRHHHKKDAPSHESGNSFDELAEIRRNQNEVASNPTADELVGNIPAKQKPSVKGKPDKNKQNSAPGGVYYNHVPGLSDTAISVQDLNNFMASHTKEFFQKQFASIPANASATITVASSPSNQHKNRYKNISAYDHSRVHLQINSEKKHGDYINASYINGFRKLNKFIASQGPTKIILVDFVRMLWEQGTEVVVMLTNLIEEGKKAEPVQILTHFHFTTWPDKDVPTTAWGLVDLEQRISHITTDKPIVVHCSAGVGRTGTFIALHNVLEEIEETGHMDFFTTVQKLRNDRIYMVQTCDQYEFLHKATQIALVCKGTTVTATNILDRTQTLEERSPSGQTNLEKEFKSVCGVCDDDVSDNDGVEEQADHMYYNSRMVTNKMKNRLHNILPKEYYRPILACTNEDKGDYINAVFVPSSKRHDHQFLTQLPLPTTITDFWRLVTQYKVTLIVAFEKDLKDKDTTIGDYLSEGDSVSTTSSSFNITTQSVDSNSNWEVQRIVITMDTENNLGMTNDLAVDKDIRLSHIKCKSTDLNSEDLLVLVRQVQSMKPVGEGRILYMCRNGATFSGLVYTLSLLLDRMDNEHQVSVPLVLGTVKAIRPQVIPTLEQYRLLYQALHLFVETNSVYSNCGNVGRSSDT